MHFRLLHARKPFRRTDNNNNNRNNSNNIYPVVEFPGLERKWRARKDKKKKKETKEEAELCSVFVHCRAAGQVTNRVDDRRTVKLLELVK